MSARFVPLTEELLGWAAAESRDPAVGLFTDTPGWQHVFLTSPAIAGALLDQGRVMAAAGLIPLWPGRGLAWLMLSPMAEPAHRAAAMREARACLFQAQRDALWRRVEMYVRADAPRRARFAEFLGMRFEGLMHAFGPFGVDHALYARVAD